jgi:hypothetical protein
MKSTWWPMIGTKAAAGLLQMGRLAGRAIYEFRKGTSLAK